MHSSDWFDRHRMITVGLFLLIIWASIWFLLYLKADEVTRDPCSICAESMGEEVTCTTSGFRPLFRKYFPDGDISNGLTEGKLLNTS